MTEWDELWDRRRIMPSWVIRMMGTDENTGKWIAKVKAEGDRLQHANDVLNDIIMELTPKAEKWDNRIKAGCMCNERYNAEKKLEAIRKLWKEKPIVFFISGFSVWTNLAMEKWESDFNEILGVEE